MKIVADLHTHSIASTHAYSTVDELCAAAARRGLTALALTDHAPSLPDSPHLWHFSGLKRLPGSIHGIRLLSGVEINVTDTAGTLDLPDKLAGSLNFVIASMHRVVFPPASPEEHTEAWLNMARHPLVDCLGHTGQPEFPFDIEAVVSVCKETGTLIEINEASFSVRKDSIEQCRKIAGLCKKTETPIVVNSDAHSAYAVGDMRLSLLMLKELEFPSELVVNASVYSLREYFLKRKHMDIFPEDENIRGFWD